MRQSLPKFDVVLLGVGHTNAHVLRMWRMQPPADARLTCVSDFGVATYSGMLPGTLAGQYQPAEMEIDLVRLCAAAGARLILDEVTGLDADNRLLQLAGRPPLRYDVLSIGIGSRPVIPAGSETLGLAIKPMQTFLERLQTRLDDIIAARGDQLLRVTIAGAGAGGVEIAFCLPGLVKRRHPRVSLQLQLIDRNGEILAGMPPRTRRLALDELANRGVEVLLGREITAAEGDDRVRLDDGSQLDTDLVLWATSASSPPLMQGLGLATDERGFLLIRNTLQTVSSDAVFAVGDSGTLSQRPPPKAGVYAVRQGPVLWQNIRRLLRGQPLKTWRPQSSFLSLLNTGDGRAMLTYKGQTLQGRWCWRLKDLIDRRFMAKYQDYTPMAMSTDPSATDAGPMSCGGCGCKLPGDVLSRVLTKLDNLAPPHVVVGLEQPDDVAVLRTAASRAVAATADFFSPFLDDPFLLGRIAALNALSDLFAKGGQPRGALALVSLPHGPARQQEDLLTQLLAGSLHELRPAGVPLVGGHTIEGAQLLIGFTILGEVDEQPLTTKSGLQPGDQLVLTKPLGTGILLAGHMRALCHHDWMQSLVASLLSSNQSAGELVRQLRLAAVTDVTGFGLAGHLLEMLRASGASAEIALDAIPVLPGTMELVQSGIESTLAPGNRAGEADIVSDNHLLSDPRYAAMFDPQTSGGLLMGAPQSQIATLLDGTGGAAVVIGRVTEAIDGRSAIHLRES